MSKKREKLSRDKRTDNGEWVYGILCDAEILGHRDENVIAKLNVNGNIVTVSMLTAGRYFGLQDKNGKRIFEEDILTVDGRDGYFWVTFDWSRDYHDHEQFFLKQGDLGIDFGEISQQEIEAVGNIHDNPELMTFPTEQ
ncbi:MAG: hypothetical protein J1F18_15690 [Lachnospiraceae bacterium]|nr:hypothetical protein [Lachnospiraceae bacterium]